MGESRANLAWRGGLALPFPSALTLLALLTVVLARGVAQALPGSFAGTDQLIRWVSLAADALSQFCAFAFGVVCLRMMVLVLVSSAPALLKAIVTVPTFATVSAVYVSADPGFHPHPVWLMTMGAALAAFALAVALRAALRPEGRGLAIVVVCVALSGVGHLIGRWLLLGEDAPVTLRVFAVARVFATAAFVGETAGLVVALVWLFSAPPKSGAARGPAGWLERPALLWSLGALGLALAPALVVSQGHEGWRLLVQRTLTSLGVHPDPLVPNWASNLLDLLVFVVCTLSALPWRRAPQLRTALALVLLGRAGFDVPLAGLFVLSGLLAMVPYLPEGSSRTGQISSAGHRASAAR